MQTAKFSSFLPVVKNCINTKYLLTKSIKWPNVSSVCLLSYGVRNEAVPKMFSNTPLSTGVLFTNFGNVFNYQVRNINIYHVDRPSPETTKENLRYKVHYPEDGKYTIKPLPVTKLSGRDQKTGRIIFGKMGGGHKQKFRWVILDRVPDGSPDPLVERVIHIQYDPMRTALIALVGHGDQLRYIIASSTMKKGDLITSTRFLPRNPIRPQEGDAHPIGALPTGTNVCCIEKLPHEGAQIMINGGCSAVISRKIEGKILIQLDAYTEFALDPNCLVTVALKMQAVVLRNISNIYLQKAVVSFFSKIILKKLSQESKRIFRQLEVKSKKCVIML